MKKIILLLSFCLPYVVQGKNNVVVTVQYAPDTKLASFFEKTIDHLKEGQRNEGGRNKVFQTANGTTLLNIQEAPMEKKIAILSTEQR